MPQYSAEELLARRRARQGQSQGTTPTLTPTSAQFEQGAEPSTLQNILDYVGRPGAATAGLAGGLLQGDPGEGVMRAWENLTGSRRDDFQDVLEEQDVLKDDPLYLQSALGFAGDVVLDPLNLVPGLGLAKKAGGALKAIPGAAKVAEFTKPLRDAVAEKFIVHSDVRHIPELRDMRRLHDSELRNIDPEAVHEYQDIYKSLGTGDEALVTRQQMQRAAAGEAIELSPEAQQVLAAQRAIHATEGQESLDLGTLSRLRENYAAHVYEKPQVEQLFRTSKLSALDPFRKAQTQTLDEALESGAISDIASASLLRSIAGRKANTTARFLRDVGQKFGKGADEAPAEWLGISEMEGLPEGLRAKLADVRFAPEVAEHLTKITAQPASQSKLAEFLQPGMQLWRQLATSARPGFHVTNLAGNVYNSLAMGADPLSLPANYGKAARWFSGGAENIGAHEADAITAMMRKHGLAADESAFGSELLQKHETPKQALEEALGTIEAKPRYIAQRAWLDPMAKLGGKVENTSRRAFFLDQLAKGKAMDEAMIETKNALFDYSELTPFESNLRNTGIPFYSFMRKNLPVQARSLVERPAVPAAYAKAKDSLEDAVAEEGTLVPERDRPEWMREAGVMQLPGLDFLKQKSPESALYLNPYLPLQDFNRLPVPGGTSFKDAGMELLSGLSPLIKTPAELIANKSFFTQYPLYDERQGILGSQATAPATIDALARLLGAEQSKTGRSQVPFPLAYALQQIPFYEGAAKGIQGVVNPEDASNPLAMLGFLGPKITERAPQQIRSDRRRSRTEERAIRRAQR